MGHRLAVSVDVDGIGLYHEIHGLPGAPAADPAWTVAVPRFLELFEGFGLHGTFFAVARDLERPENRAVAEEVLRRGHELANHSYTHPYDLSRKSEAEIETELAESERVLGELRGSPVRGFRAPGYNLSAPLRAALARRGYAYDSSVFPCPPYFAARATILGAMRLVGRKSQSILGDPRDAMGPTNPVRLGPGLVELPISVLPGLRFPLLGTALSLLGEIGVTALTPLLRGLPFANFEFHAIDLLDDTDVPNPALRAVQPDLRISRVRKRAAFAAALRPLVAGSTARTLEEHAAELQSTL